MYCIFGPYLKRENSLSEGNDNGKKNIVNYTYNRDTCIGFTEIILRESLSF